MSTISSILRVTISKFVVCYCYSLLFKDVGYEELDRRSFALKSEFANVDSANVLFGTKIIVEGNRRCTPAVLRISDVSSIETDKQRPQILISGEIHGDERVGPSASLYTAELIVRSALCEIKKDRKTCRELETIGIVKGHRVWLTHLVTRRDIIIIPALNCLGYMKNHRNDGGIDPNRDFAYVRADTNCMLSTTAHILNKIFNDNIIQLVVTFHGGMEAIG